MNGRTAYTSEIGLAYLTSPSGEIEDEENADINTGPHISRR